MHSPTSTFQNALAILIALLLIGDVSALVLTDLLIQGKLMPLTALSNGTYDAIAGFSIFGIADSVFGTYVLSADATGKTMMTIMNTTADPMVNSPLPSVMIAPSTPNCFRVTSDGTQLYSIYSTDLYSVMDLATGTVVVVQPDGATPAGSVNTNPSTATFATRLMTIGSQCLDFAPGGGNNLGFAGMLTDSSAVVVFQKDSVRAPMGLTDKGYSVDSGIGISLAEQPLIADYSVVTYYVGLSSGIIISLVVSDRRTAMGNTFNMTQVGYVSDVDTYNVTALAWANNLLHVGGLGFYTALDTTNSTNLTPYNLVNWGILGTFSATVQYIRTPRGSLNITTAWITGYF